MRILTAKEDNILRASRIIARGGLVVYPTDTVYGLGCDPLNIEAVTRVLNVKGEREKPLPILASDINSVKKIGFVSERAGRIAARFWPGPLTIVVPKKPVLPNLVTCKLNSVGVRIPQHEVAVRLISLSNGLLVGTSANKTGEKPPRTAREAAEQLGKEVDMILDGGPAPLGVPSTVVDLSQEKLKILREGSISLEELVNT
ncbi:MAG: threonylcarbamoyl-AMP synthase [Candidatus Bathyarchaeota archaeon]|nr:MAG: threonylcarbamoyl-AMP synthase [Candidatus Bathyarchaeota archaeon]